MTHTPLATRRLLRRQSVGGVCLVGHHVVWRCAEEEYVVWPECNVFSAIPAGCRYSLPQAIKVLTKRR